MIWALLALLGIPIWFIAIILVAVLRNRRRVRSRPDVFRFVDATDEGWRRTVGYARWVSDVLIVHTGPALVGTDAQQVTDVTIEGETIEPIKKLGGDAVQVTWNFAASGPRRVAVSRSDVDRALG
jgi:hypothetical protein